MAHEPDDGDAERRRDEAPPAPEASDRTRTVQVPASLLQKARTAFAPSFDGFSDDSDDNSDKTKLTEVSQSTLLALRLLAMRESDGACAATEPTADVALASSSSSSSSQARDPAEVRAAPSPAPAARPQASAPPEEPPSGSGSSAFAGAVSASFYVTSAALVIVTLIAVYLSSR